MADRETYEDDVSRWQRIKALERERDRLLAQLAAREREREG